MIFIISAQNLKLMNKYHNDQVDSISILKAHIDNRKDIPESFLGFYHENDINSIQLLYLEEKGCEIYGKTLKEINAIGPEFLQEIMHPDDINRCVNLLLEFANSKNEDKILSYNQRLKLLDEDVYKTYFTCVKANFSRNVFQCVTTPMTNIDGFYSEVNTILDSSEYIEKNIKLYTSFSKREKEVIKWVCKGKTVYEIADILFLSHHTIIKHKKNIYKKGCFNSKLELIEFALNYSII